MLGFHEQRRLKRILYSPIVLVLLLVLSGFLAWKVFGVYTKERETNERRVTEEALLEELKAREAFLRAEIERLSSERGLEEEVRSRFEVGKAGEELVVIVDAPESSGGAPRATQSFFTRLWDRFFGGE